MGEARQWVEATGEEPPQSIRTIIKNEGAASRILIREIRREQIREGVRSNIARMMRDKTPWEAPEHSPATVPTDSTAQALSMRELFPPHDFGTWPKGFAASREQMYGNHGR